MERKHIVHSKLECFRIRREVLFQSYEYNYKNSLEENSGSLQECNRLEQLLTEVNKNIFNLQEEEVEV